MTQGVDSAPSPPAHTLTIAAGPTGIPNPAASGASVNLDVTVVDSLGHAISYGWVASCQGLPSNGSFNNVASRTPVWTATTNDTGTPKSCTIQVTANDANGLIRQGALSQEVAPAPVPTLSVAVVATGCTTCHSGQIVGYRLDFANTGPATSAELRGGARFPDGSILMFVNQVVTIPTGASSMTLVPSQALPMGLPTIDLVVEAAIIEPGLAVTRSRHSTTLHLLP